MAVCPCVAIVPQKMYEDMHRIDTISCIFLAITNRFFLNLENFAVIAIPVPFSLLYQRKLYGVMHEIEPNITFLQCHFIVSSCTGCLDQSRQRPCSYRSQRIPFPTPTKVKATVA